MEITNINPIYWSQRQERIAEIKEDIHRPVDEVFVTRTLHQHGFNYDDLTDVEKINLFI